MIPYENLPENIQQGYNALFLIYSKLIYITYYLIFQSLKASASYISVLYAMY